MLNYKEMYLRLFRAVSDSLGAMDEFNFGLAARILTRAQQEAEEQYCEDTETAAD